MTPFEDYIIPIANEKMFRLHDNHGISILNTEWIVFLLVAAAQLKASGLEYKNGKQTLDYAFELRFNNDKKRAFYGEHKHSYICRTELKSYDAPHFLKKFWDQLPEVNYADIITGEVVYSRTFNVILNKYSHYHAAELLIEDSESLLNDLIRMNYLEIELTEN